MSHGSEIIGVIIFIFCVLAITYTYEIKLAILFRSKPKQLLVKKFFSLYKVFVQYK